MTFDLGRSAKLAFAALTSLTMLAACSGSDSEATPAISGQGDVVSRGGVQSGNQLLFHKVSKEWSSYYRVVDCRTGAVGIHTSSVSPIISGSPAYFTPEGTAAVAAFCKANGREPGFVDAPASIEAKALSGPRVIMNEIQTPSGYSNYVTGIDCDTGMTWGGSGSPSVTVVSALPVGTTAAALDSLAQACRAQGSTPGFVPSAQ